MIRFILCKASLLLWTTLEFAALPGVIKSRLTIGFGLKAFSEDNFCESQDFEVKFWFEDLSVWQAVYVVALRLAEWEITGIWKQKVTINIIFKEV